jgi:hypothetical protein
MWAGTANRVPTGWVLCDGSVQSVRDPDGHDFPVPNLSDKFILGASAAHPSGSSQVVTSVKLAAANMPAHKHGTNVTTSAAGGHAHAVVRERKRRDDDGNVIGTLPISQNIVDSTFGIGTLHRVNVQEAPGERNDARDDRLITDSVGDHTHTVTVNSTGQDDPTPLTLPLPPFFALAFIMKTT